MHLPVARSCLLRFHPFRSRLPHVGSTDGADPALISSHASHNRSRADRRRPASQEHAAGRSTVRNAGAVVRSGAEASMHPMPSQQSGRFLCVRPSPTAPRNTSHPCRHALPATITACPSHCPIAQSECTRALRARRAAQATVARSSQPPPDATALSCCARPHDQHEEAFALPSPHTRGTCTHQARHLIDRIRQDQPTRSCRVEV